MVYDGVLKGRFVELKSATIEDADFTLKIRQDPEKTKYLPCLNITLEQQKEWILKQRDKDGDYFFVAWSLTSGERIGTLSVYDIHNGIGEGGRLALYGESHEKIEAGLLLSHFEFAILKLEKVVGWVYSDNSSALRWNKSFGASFSEKKRLEDGSTFYNICIERKASEIAQIKLNRMISRIKD